MYLRRATLVETNGLSRHPQGRIDLTPALMVLLKKSKRRLSTEPTLDTREEPGHISENEPDEHAGNTTTHLDVEMAPVQND